MSVLQTNELGVLTDALTSFVLAFESTSDAKRRHQMQKRMRGCYDQALHNAKKAEQEAREYNRLKNQLRVEHFGLEAAKWRLIADAVLNVMELVEHD